MDSSKSKTYILVIGLLCIAFLILGMVLQDRVGFTFGSLFKESYVFRDMRWGDPAPMGPAFIHHSYDQGVDWYRMRDDDWYFDSLQIYSPFTYGYTDGRLSAIVFGVNKPYEAAIDLFVEKYGQQELYVLPALYGTKDEVHIWRTKDLAVSIFIEGWTSASTIGITLSTHEFLKDYMFDVYGMDENTKPMVEINIGNPALEKLIRGIEGSSYTDTPKYEDVVPGIFHPRGVRFYKPDGPLYVQEVEQITELYSDSVEGKITSLDGIENCINLRFLSLSDHQITDISPLRSLQSLELLYLEADTIKNFSPLLDLPNLVEIYLIGNPPSSDNRKEVAEELRSRGVRVYYY